MRRVRGIYDVTGVEDEMRQRTAGLVTLCVAAVVGCDTFEFVAEPGDTGTGGSSSTSGAAGDGGSAGTTSTGNGGEAGEGPGGSGGNTGGAAGTMSTGTAGAGGSAGTGGSSSTSSSSSSSGGGGTGGNTGSGGAGAGGGSTGGSGGGAGGAEACPDPTEKSCGGNCVPLDDPNFGCDPAICKPCSLAHASEACSAGECVVATCDNGYADCDGGRGNGCEKNTSNDPQNCGACNSPCNLAHAIAGCVNGACTIASCEADYADCDKDAVNGCEAKTQTDPQNCGSCGKACNQQFQTCAAGKCEQNACAAGKQDCDNNPGNGCETQLGTVSDCAYCDNVCSLPHAVPVCMQGVCLVANCVGEYADCDGEAVNGCEADTNNDPAHCGSCQKSCSLAHATATCKVGACQIADCDVGYKDCDADGDTGCEQNIASDIAHCGGCSKPCSLPNANPDCVSGLCVVGSCKGSFANCDNQSANGCEVDTSSSPANCGTCGKACSFANAAASCQGGSCQLGACNTGFANCDNQFANGCEQDVASDAANCGACGHACNSGETCSAGKCVGPCGPVQLGVWSVCVDYPHDPANGRIGFAGAIVPPGKQVSMLWAGPMVGCAPSCASPDPNAQTFSMNVGVPVTGTQVYLRPAIYQGNSVFAWGCTDQGCIFFKFLYIYDPTGKRVGAVENGAASGLVTLVTHYQPPPYKDVLFTIP